MTLFVEKPTNGRVVWTTRLDPLPLSVSSEDLDGAQSLTAVLRERVAQIPDLPPIVVETARFDQVQEPNPIP
jgi:hypothetical protein